MGYRVFLLDALGISDLYAQWATVFFCLMLSVYRIFVPSGLSVFFVLDVLSVYWILCPVGYLCFLFDALGILDLYAQWTTVFFCLMLSVYWIFMPSGLSVFFVLNVLSVYWILRPVGYLCFLCLMCSRYIGSYAQWATCVFCLMLSVYWIFMPSGLPCFFV